MTLALSTNHSESVERVELFSIDDVTYTIPNKVRVNVQLKYLYTLKTEGEMAATYEVLHELLGDDGYQALMNYDDLTEEDFNDVVQVAQKIVMGESEGKAQGKTGSK